MTQQKKKKIAMAVFGCASMGALAGCGSTNEVVEKSSDVATNNNDVDSAVEIVKNEKLAVDQNKCVGCGKCPRIASANFAMNDEREAEVISQEITSQANVDRAVNACPVNAITQ